MKQYLQCLDGMIEIDSSEGNGTCVTMTIPAKLASAPENPHNINQEALMPEKMKEKNARVLIVEDNPMAMNIAVLMLEKANCTVVKASNASQALRLAQNQRFDFILSDIGLPDFSGFLLAKKIHEFEKQQGLELTPIIGLTAHAKTDALAQEECSDMMDICEKPLRMDALHPFIEQYTVHNAPTAPIAGNDTEYFHDIPLFEINTIENQLGNPKVVKNVIRYMLENELPESLDQIHQAYRMQDWQYLAKVMHRFKSSCLYCATTRLLKITQQLEKEIEEASKQRKIELYQAFQQIAQDTRQALHHWLNA